MESVRLFYFSVKLTIPGESWQPQEHPAQYPHEYIKDGTAKLLTLFHPKDGKVRVKGVQSCTNQVLHPWLKQEVSAHKVWFVEEAVGIYLLSNLLRLELAI